MNCYFITICSRRRCTLLPIYVESKTIRRDMRDVGCRRCWLLFGA